MGQIDVNYSSIVSITKVEHFYFAIDNNILRSNCLPLCFNFPKYTCWFWRL